jgi:hypothetical protein
LIFQAGIQLAIGMEGHQQKDPNAGQVCQKLK